MKKLSVNLENCYGIEKLNKEFYFEEHNVNIIYAKNGLMKTSFAKVFKKIQDNKQKEIKDEIFEKQTIVDIKINDKDIKKDDVFVIKSFENYYESDSIAALLINPEIKTELSEVLGIRDNLFKKLADKSKLRISKTYLGKTVYELEPAILKDFKISSFLQNIDEIDIESINTNFSYIEYGKIFDESGLKIIENDKFQEKIVDFIKKSYEVYQSYNFLDKGKFTLPKLKDITKRLGESNFFEKNNKIILEGINEPQDLKLLNKTISNIEESLKSTSEYKDIEKLLNSSKGIEIRDIIETYPEIIEELKISNIPFLKKKIWLSYLKDENEIFDLLKSKYLILKNEIKNLNIDETPWQEAINIFNNRFTLPFQMEIINIESSIIGESLPKISFNFYRDGNNENKSIENIVKITRDDIEKKDTLSQGEKRALYLLNIIFDIQKIKRENKKTLFIIDDIADSFDYKNKYAIVEYLRDISKEDKFYLIILSHNFDFYRIISSRLLGNRHRDNKLHTLKSSSEILINKEHYQDKPFIYWQKNIIANEKGKDVQQDKLLVRKYFLALIPFVRNLIEYGKDRNKNDLSISEDFLVFTNLLHYKDITKQITFGNIKKLYKEYLYIEKFDSSLDDNIFIYNEIISIAENNINDDKLENKLILAIAIRLKADELMKNKIYNSTHLFSWNEGTKKNPINKTGTGIEYLDFVKHNDNQTMVLYNGIKQFENSSLIIILDSVNIMVPENIHINSFMYEPLLDMDIIELENLYLKIKALM